MTLTQTIRREIGAAYDSATLAADTPVLFTRQNVIDTAAERIEAAIHRHLLTKEGMTMSTLLGYEAGVETGKVKRDDR